MPVCWQEDILLQKCNKIQIKLCAKSILARLWWHKCIHAILWFYFNHLGGIMASNWKYWKWFVTGNWQDFLCSCTFKNVRPLELFERLKNPSRINSRNFMSLRSCSFPILIILYWGDAVVYYCCTNNGFYNQNSFV